MRSETKRILEAVREGTLSVDEALLKLKTEPFDDIGFAKVDLHRGTRQGFPEVIYGAGKTPEQILGIIRSTPPPAPVIVPITTAITAEQPISSALVIPRRVKMARPMVSNRNIVPAIRSTSLWKK